MGSPRYLIVSTVSSFVPASQQAPKKCLGTFQRIEEAVLRTFVVFGVEKRAQTRGQKQNAKLCTWNAVTPKRSLSAGALSFKVLRS